MTKTEIQKCELKTKPKVYQEVLVHLYVYEQSRDIRDTQVKNNIRIIKLIIKSLYQSKEMRLQRKLLQMMAFTRQQHDSKTQWN